MKTRKFAGSEPIYDDKGNTIGDVTCSIDKDLKDFSIGVFMYDNSTSGINQQNIKKVFDKFYEDFKLEAIKCGWTCLESIPNNIS